MRLFKPTPVNSHDMTCRSTTENEVRKKVIYERARFNRRNQLPGERDSWPVHHGPAHARCELYADDAYAKSAPEGVTTECKEGMQCPFVSHFLFPFLRSWFYQFPSLVQPGEKARIHIYHVITMATGPPSFSNFSSRLFTTHAAFSRQSGGGAPTSCPAVLTFLLWDILMCSRDKWSTPAAASTQWSAQVSRNFDPISKSDTFCPRNVLLSWI